MVMVIPEDTYWQFFRADRARDAQAWAAVMNYPHLRVVATGRTELFQNLEQYAKQATWTEREATGWVQTEGVEPTRIFETDDLVVLNGGWTRLNARDEPILQNRVVYVLSRIENSWGVQARFACGAMPHWQASDDERPVDLVSSFVRAIHRQGIHDGGRFVRLPCVHVEVGKVEQIANTTEVSQFLGRFRARRDGIVNIEAIQNGPIGSNVSATWNLESGQVAHGVFLVGKEPECAILAMSLVTSAE